MNVSLPNPSSRLLRAAVAEQADLVRHRERLTHERAGLLGELREIDHALITVDRRLEVLAELAGRSHHISADNLPAASATAATPATAPTPTPTTPVHAAETTDAARRDEVRPALRGPTIRETALRVLLAQPERIDALHYRRWYELLVEAGFQVAGKDPVAVFLTQLSRSPLVRKTSAPGVYEVDRQAPLRIRHRLERLQAELREVTVAAPGPIALGAVRARRHELDVAISQQERALEEALRVLGGEHGETAAPGTARAG